MREAFIDAIRARQAEFGLSLDEASIHRLADYYEIVQLHNPLLHLVAPAPAEEFATRHILESLTLLKFLPQQARFADVGTGAGLPSIPCLLVRPDLSAVLIESKIKKARFLEEAASELSVASRVQIINRQFEEAEAGNFQIVTCRALDKFTERLPRMLKWAWRRRLLFFGGPGLRDALRKEKVKFEERLMPLSEQRYLFIVSGG